MEQSRPGLTSEPVIAWSDFTRFLRQLSHDLRNHLNAIELQSALLNELITDQEARTDVARLRENVGQMSKALQQVVTAVSQPNPQLIPYQASDLLQDLNEHVTRAVPESEGAVTWNVKVESQMIDLDPQLLFQGFTELISNALQHTRGSGPITVDAGVTDRALVITITEPKEKLEGDMSQWGRQPLQGLARGHYGLGLVRARAIFEAQHAVFTADFKPDEKILVTKVELPLATAPS